MVTVSSVPPPMRWRNVVIGARPGTFHSPVTATGRRRTTECGTRPTFFEVVGQADELASPAGDPAPDDPTPRATAVLTARGLQVPRHGFDARWDALVARDPLHWTGHRRALQHPCAKRSGSHKEMFEFARNAAERAPVAFHLSRPERRSEAAAQFPAMGRRASTSGWQYALSPRQAFLRDRAAALRLPGSSQ